MITYHMFFSFDFFIFGGHKSFLWGHRYPCFGLLMVCTLGFKARVDPMLACFLACVTLRFPSDMTPADCKDRHGFFVQDPYTCLFQL